MQIQPPPFPAVPDAAGREIHALILDDSAFDRKRIRRMGAGLGAAFHLQEAPSLEALTRHLDETAFDLVMIDYRLPEGDGFAALDLVQNHAAQKNAATIMISGTARTGLAVSALKQGCSDFVDKQDLTPATFRQTVLAAMASSRDAAMPSDRIVPDLAASDPGRLLALALGDPRVRAALQPAIADGLRQALAALAYGALTTDTAAPEQFMAAFLVPDEFVFRH